MLPQFQLPMSGNLPTVLVGVVGLFLSAAAVAGDLAACAAIDDDRERLACYDALAGRKSDRPQAPTGAATATSLPAAAAPGATEEFGLSEASKKARDPERYAASRPASITGQVKQTSRDPYDRFIVTLDNGQVWVQNEGRSGIYPRPGETVTITQGSLGGFALRSERFGTVRVRRVK